MSFDALLIANRGEIAIRIARTAQLLGMRTIAVVSDADRGAPHARACDDVVEIGGTRPADSYLRIDKLLDAARASGAQAVHPGYGFLAESALFAQSVVDAGLVFVGPPPSAIAAMGDKAAARQRAVALGVSVLTGYDSAAQDVETLRRAAVLIGFPVMIKAAAGGGGRGMRRVDDAAHFDAALASARSEAQASFGDDRLIIERALRAPRHVEIQVLADAHGHAVFLGERDCSVQRRHQKIIEEAPCPVLAPNERRAMGEAALRLARAIGYVGAGTVEFLYAGGESFFMEMNTRLQVEHPVTEAVLGLDLVEWQLRIARGERLALEQNEVLERFERGGHAIEARLCAEDPGADFLPRTGRIVAFHQPPAIRFDHAIESGLDVSPFYDSLLGKMIAHAPSRGEAAQQLAAALERTVVLGVATNRTFLARVLRHPAFLEGAVSTALIEDHFAAVDARVSSPSDAHWAAAAFISTRVDASGTEWPPEWNGWSSSGALVTAFRLRAGDIERRGRVEGSGVRGAAVIGERMLRIDAGGPLESGIWNALMIEGRRSALFFARNADRIWVQVDGIEIEFEDLRLQPATRSRGAAAAGAVAATMHGRVVDVAVRVGQRVDRGAALATLEAMKMEHALAAPAPGLVRAVHVRTGDQIAAGRVMIEIDLDAPHAGAAGGC
ncbi:MAG TPA: biotin carboxylase N-terminal domain-containing protein [Burkholderiaceae bacterium]|nr:biotin carboxylase N-terminal domain-containing protein [Burkholderiaceae bacterium]